MKIVRECRVSRCNGNEARKTKASPRNNNTDDAASGKTQRHFPRDSLFVTSFLPPFPSELSNCVAVVGNVQCSSGRYKEERFINNTIHKAHPAHAAAFLSFLLFLLSLRVLFFFCLFLRRRGESYYFRVNDVL